ncbi:alpha/beta hydrolase [Mycolicibacterium sp. PDY-3]|uniref:alpha/beta hydrolase n=1 Tax=Mycolicibacterium sp. PDY-3 TaxID=3376069 RepID=UPI00379AFD96
MSLTHGSVPTTIQIVTGTIVLIALRKQRPRVLIAAAAVGLAAILATNWYINSQGLADEPAPPALWIWVGTTGFACCALLAGWRGARFLRRAAMFSAVPLSAVCVALAVNVWTGYFPTVGSAWGQLTDEPLPDQTDLATLTAYHIGHSLPPKGSLIAVDTGNANSGFEHRGELVYLPPAWFASNPPPRLPAVMMIGGELNTPEDWARAGAAVQTADNFAAQHHGNAPVLVFADVAGAFSNDTECVNGVRGNVADHLTKDVVPFVISKFGVSADPANWGVAGFSMGGTCAVNLVTMHPDHFSSFVDIAGDLAPNTGNREQTIDRLFGGNAAAYDEFDPVTVMNRHGQYSGVSGWFAINGAGVSPPPPQAGAAKTLCDVATAHGIECGIVTRPGNHDWAYAGSALAEALPWLAAKVHTPEVAPTAIPTGSPAPAAAPGGPGPAAPGGPAPAAPAAPAAPVPAPPPGPPAPMPAVPMHTAPAVPAVQPVANHRVAQ